MTGVHHVFAHACCDRNRRCITANLHTPEGREIVKQLSSHADVLLENFRPGVMEKWGLVGGCCYNGYNGYDV